MIEAATFSAELELIPELDSGQLSDASCLDPATAGVGVLILASGGWRLGSFSELSSRLVINSSLLTDWPGWDPEKLEAS